MSWWTALILAGGVGLAAAVAVSLDQLRNGWHHARARSRARRQLDRDGWNPPR